MLVAGLMFLSPFRCCHFGSSVFPVCSVPDFLGAFRTWFRANEVHKQLFFFFILRVFFCYVFVFIFFSGPSTRYCFRNELRHTFHDRDGASGVTVAFEFRHEQQTVPVARAGALHHSRVVRPVSHNAPRSQKHNAPRGRMHLLPEDRHGPPETHCRHQDDSGDVAPHSSPLTKAT